MMAAIRARDTAPERVVRRALFAQGYRFRLHRRDLAGCPDIVLPGRRVVIFVHGCFWHQHEACRNASMPSSNAKFWRAKLTATVERDRKATSALLSDGWRVLAVWECATRSLCAENSLPRELSAWINGDHSCGSIPPSR